MARTPIAAKIEEPAVTEPADSGLFGGDDLAAPVAPAAGYRPLLPPPRPGSYGPMPYDHGPVWLTADGQSWVEAQWQTSRHMVAGRWMPLGFWAQRNTGGKVVEFEPVGWREIER